MEATMFSYNTWARRAQVQCVFLTVVLMQILRASDIETHPDPHVELEQTLQRMFDQQEKRLDTFFFFFLQFDTVWDIRQSVIVKSGKCTQCCEDSISQQAKVMDLNEHNMNMIDAQRKTSYAVKT